MLLISLSSSLHILCSHIKCLLLRNMFKPFFPYDKVTIKGQMSTWEEKCANLKRISVISSGQSAWWGHLASGEFDKVKFLQALILCCMYLFASVSKRTINVQDSLEPPNVAEESKPNQTCPCTNTFIWFYITQKVIFIFYITLFLDYLLLSCGVHCDKQTQCFKIRPNILVRHHV